MTTGLIINPGVAINAGVILNGSTSTTGGSTTPDGTNPQDYGYGSSTGSGSGGAPGTGGPYTNLPGYTRPLTAKSFTIECWVKWDTGATIAGCLFGGPTDGYWQPHFLTLYVNSSTQIVTDQYYVGANHFDLSTPLVDNTWYHIAVSRDHANGDLEAVWINGVLVDSHVDEFIYPGNSTTVADGWPNLDTGGDLKFQGKQADLRVVAGVCLYDPTVSTITVPTAPLEVVFSTVLLLRSPPMGEPAVDASPVNQQLTITGNIVHSSDSPYAGGPGSWRNTDGMGRIAMSPGIYFAGAPSIPITYDQLTGFASTESGPGFTTGQFTLTDPLRTGVVFSVTDSAIISAFAATPYNSGYVWTATWSLGSTQTTTPVAMFYGGNVYSGPVPGTVLFWVLDPADNTYTTGLAGTFKFPVAFTPGTTVVTSTPG
jgi:hypothetical protein